MTGKDIRLKRLFSRGNAVIVAADHGEFDGPIAGMIDLPRVLAEAIHPEVDGVLLSPGMVTQCGEVFARRGGPLAVMRLNWSTVYAFHWGYQEAATVPAMGVEEAVSRGAEVALISLSLHTGSEERDARNVEVFSQLRAEAHRLNELGARAAEVDGAAAPLHGDNLAQDLLRLHRLIAGRGRVAPQSEDHGVPLPFFQCGHAMGTYAHVQPVHENVKGFDLPEFHGLHGDEFSIPDRGVHAMSGGPKPNAVAASQKIREQMEKVIGSGGYGRAGMYGKRKGGGSEVV